MTRTPRHRRRWTVHAGDLTFTLTAPSRWADDQQRYLAGYLPGAPGDHDLGHFGIDVHLDDLKVHQVAQKIAHASVVHQVEPIPGVVLRETQESSGRRYYAVAEDNLEHQNHTYVVTIRGRDIELYIHGNNTRPHAYPLRFMREAMLRTYEDAGGVVFHAAGVDLEGVGVMICGPRTAGKTTTLACLLRATGGGLLSNDRLIVHGSERLIPVPLPVPVGRGTVEVIDELHAAVTTLSRPQREPATLPDAFGATAKVEFSAHEYATALGCSLAPASKLRGIVVPQFTDTDARVRARRLDARQAHQVLAASCFTPRDEFWIRPWLVPRQRSDAELAAHADQVVTHIATSVPVVEISYGVRRPLEELDKTLRDAIKDFR